MLPAIVAQRIDVAAGLMVLRVAPDGWELPEFLPGQYVVLGLPACAPRCTGSDQEPQAAEPNKMIRRAYSIASSSVARQYFEFYVALVQSGELTPRLFALEVGQRVWLGRKVTGAFTLDQTPGDKHLVLMGTGTGIAPYMSMVRSVLAAQPQRRFAIVHGARYSCDLGYREELQALKRSHPHLDYLPIISRPGREPSPWSGLVGYCQDLWASREIDRRWGLCVQPDNTRIFLCGNPAMIEQTLGILSAEGFRQHSRRTPGEVHLEKYW